MVFDSARKAITSLTRKVTKKGTSKKKSKDLGTSKRRRKDDTSEEEEEADNPNDSDFIQPMKRPVPHSWWMKMVLMFIMRIFLETLLSSMSLAPQMQL
jgi:hypothetical protein